MFFNTCFVAVVVEDRISSGSSSVKPLPFHAKQPFLYYLKINDIITFVGRLNKIEPTENYNEHPSLEVEPLHPSEVKEPSQLNIGKPEIQVPPHVESSSYPETTPTAVTTSKMHIPPKLESTPRVETTPKVESTTKGNTISKVETAETTPKLFTPPYITPKENNVPKGNSRI